jgi:predicted GH43/DUF377 family glycosyl hydrolase
MKTHAALPVPHLRRGDLYRIYFATRDSDSRSRIGFVELRLREPQSILNISEAPVLNIGTLGDFDHYGVLPACIVDHQSQVYLYYSGWDRGADVNRYFVGLSISDDGGTTFRKIANVPILDRSREDPYFCASPFVIIENGKWRMWYSSGINWRRIADRSVPRYHLKYAESDDGITWQAKGIICIGLESDDEWAIARPTVAKENGTYKMLYSYSRGSKGYRIGYAESQDGLRWVRMDEIAGLDVSTTGWDSEMVCYPYMFEHEGVKYVLYNGNRFGRTGFGYAVEE